MEVAPDTATPTMDPPTGRRRVWLRVGLISAALWVVIGLAIAYVSSLPGVPTVTGWLPVLTGPVVLRFVGRRQQLHDSWAWTQAGLLQLGVVILVISVTVYAAVLGGFLGPGDSSSIEAVSFGTGGTDCAITTVASTFKPVDPIRAAAEFSPDLPAGTHVMMWLSRDGHEVQGSRQMLTLDAPAGCVSGPVSISPLVAGHYQWDVVPDNASQAIGEFDIVP